MKKTLITSALLCSFWIPKSMAQYNFTTTTAPYVNLTGGTSFHPVATADTIIAPGFQVTINGVTNDTVFLRIPFGRINTQMPNAAAASLHSFDAEQIGGTHQYTVSGTPGNRVLKMQYKSIKFGHDWTTQDSINYQVWIFESGNIIELHFGPGSVLCPQSYYVPGTGTTNGAAIGFYGLWLTGNPASPTTTATSGSTLNGTPPSGTVYRFTPVSSGIKMIGNSEAQQPVLFPNPATDKLFFTGGPTNMDYVITDLSGRIILSGNTGENQINIGTLVKGTYMITVFSGKIAAGKYCFLKL